MIKIEHKDIDSIVTLFYEAVKPYVEARLKFVIGLLEQKKDISKLEKDYGLDGRISKPLIQPFLKKEFKGKDKGIVFLRDTKDILIDNASSYVDFFKCVEKKLDEIITGKPSKLEKFKTDFELKIKEIIKNSPKVSKDSRAEFKKETKARIKEILEKILDYELLTGAGFVSEDNQKFTSYTLTSKLGLSVCPYCNRNWIMTVFRKGGGKVTNPQLDHFFSKSEFPVLRLSFYNLIPSCETCNARLKKGEEFKYEEHLHPYIKGYSTNAKFKVTPKSYEAAIGKNTDYEIGIEYITKDKITKKQIENNHEVFKINKIYEHHGDIISEIYRKKYVWNEKYLQVLRDSFSDLNLSNKEMYRLLIGNNIDETDFHKRPLSLLMRDLTEDLDMVEKK